MVGQHQLHPKALMMAAGNLENDNAIVNPMGSALISRFAHFYIDVSHADWMEWAAGNIDIRITSFLGAFPKHLYNFNPDVTTPYACPRTHEMLSDTIKDQPIQEMHKPLVASLIGDGIATEFMSFLKLYKDIAKFEDIIADPANALLSDNMSVRWAVMGVIVHNITEDNIKKCAVYFKRFPLELQICALREIKARYPALITTHLREWLLEVSSKVY